MSELDGVEEQGEAFRLVAGDHGNDISLLKPLADVLFQGVRLTKKPRPKAAGPDQMPQRTPAWPGPTHPPD